MDLAVAWNRWRALTLRQNLPWLAGISVVGNLIWWGADRLVYPELAGRMVWVRLGFIETFAVLAALLTALGYRSIGFPLLTVTLQVGAALVVASANGPGDPYISGVLFVMVAPAASG